MTRPVPLPVALLLAVPALVLFFVGGIVCLVLGIEWGEER